MAETVRPSVVAMARRILENSEGSGDCDAKIALGDLRALSQAVVALSRPSPQPEVSAEERERIAKMLWERFAPDHEVEWPEGVTNRAEYYSVADDIAAARSPSAPAGEGRLATHPWKDLSAHYAGSWAYEYDEHGSMFLIHRGGHRIAYALDSEVAHAICLAHNVQDLAARSDPPQEVQRYREALEQLAYGDLGSPEDRIRAREALQSLETALAHIAALGPRAALQQEA